MGVPEKRDPINRVFFEKKPKSEQMVEDFIFERGRKKITRRKKRGARTQEQEKTPPTRFEQAEPTVHRDLLAENKPTPMKRIGVCDQFGRSGKPAELIEKYCLTSRHIAEAAKQVLSRK